MILFKMRNAIDQLTGSVTARGDADSTLASTSSSVATKLSQIDLPTFDGNYLNWISFDDQFTTAIDSNV